MRTDDLETIGIVEMNVDGDGKGKEKPMKEWMNGIEYE